MAPPAAPLAAGDSDGARWAMATIGQLGWPPSGNSEGLVASAPTGRCAGVAGLGGVMAPCAAEGAMPEVCGLEAHGAAEDDVGGLDPAGAAEA